MASSVEGPEEVPSNEKEQQKTADNVRPEKGEETDDIKTHTLQSQEKTMSIVVHEQIPKEPDDGASVSSVERVKVFHATPHPLQSIKDGRSPAIREKVLEDGYNWRKYGQKLVKGNEFIRSYYKCTHPSCQVKKQLERSHEGQLADIVYFGQHDHPKPQANLTPAVGFVSSIEERSDGPLSPAVKVGKGRPPINPTNASQMSTLTSTEDVRTVPSEVTRKRDEIDQEDDHQSKRQKKANRGIVDPPVVDKPAGEPRVVVQTLSEEDIVNDGYRWRKYGQKMVKGNPNPRSYYRCSSPGCPVKKHVERASHDPKVVITSYEGEHDHDMPPSRTVTHNIPGLDACTSNVPTEQIDCSTPACNTPDANAKPKEQLNGASRTKAKGDKGKEGLVDKGSDKVCSSPIHLDELKSKDQQNEKSSALEESDAADHDSDATTSFILEGRTNDQPTGESKEASEENGCDSKVHSAATTHPDCKPTQQHIPDSEPVQLN
ncbi:unnamed protein product [Linum trigynum]|uniref:WRKY domain-containing protein n=1 Tax=Linum trigynum TaxID=586398 RepID=A0AAV2CKE6_9ROSI